MTPREGVALGVPLVQLILDIIAAARRDSEGGVRITPAEWLHIGRAAGVVILEAAEAAD